jgi:hypothetical protein
MTWRPYAIISGKSESKFMYKAGLNACQRYMKTRWNLDIFWTVSCGDPMRALPAAILEANPDAINTKDVEHVRRIWGKNLNR